MNNVRAGRRVRHARPAHAGQATPHAAGYIWTSLLGFSGFAAIPNTMLDPPHGAASPMVPAFIGSGSPYLTQAPGVSAIGPSVSISAIF